jgi:hypothetical protein
MKRIIYLFLFLLVSVVGQGQPIRFGSNKGGTSDTTGNYIIRAQQIHDSIEAIRDAAIAGVALGDSGNTPTALHYMTATMGSKKLNLADSGAVAEAGHYFTATMGSLKANIASPTFTGTVTTPILTVGTGKVSIDSIVKSGTDIKFYDGAVQLNPQDNDTVTLFDVVDKSPLQEIQAMGSSAKALPIMFNIPDEEITDSLADARGFFVAFYIPRTTTITGVKWWNREQGVYVANNTNEVALYKESAGVLTKVDSCANDGNLWKQAAWAIGTKAFTATYSAAPGIYYVAILLNHSNMTTEPRIYITEDDIGMGFGFTNSNKLHGYVNGLSILPHTQALSGVTVSANGRVIWLY